MSRSTMLLGAAALSAVALMNTAAFAQEGGPDGRAARHRPPRPGRPVLPRCSPADPLVDAAAGSLNGLVSHLGGRAQA